MSKGIVHTKASLILAGGFLVGTAFTLDPHNLQYVAGALISVILNPDLDVDHGQTDGFKVVKHAGSVVSTGWRYAWYMYRHSLRHGGELSHFPVVGTLGRILYLYLSVIVVPYLVLAPVLHLDFWGEITWWLWWIVVHYKVTLALAGSDFIHWSLDVLTTEHRKRVKNGRYQIDSRRNGREEDS